MNLSYFRIKRPFDEALKRFYEWEEGEPDEIINTSYSKAVDNSLDENGQWKGSCLYCYESKGWTVFEDLSGFLSGFSIPPEDWLKLAGKDSFVMAGENDAIPYGELVVIENGNVVKEFLNDLTDEDADVNNGSAYPEIKGWMDVDGFIEKDDIVYSEKGTLLIYH